MSRNNQNFINNKQSEFNYNKNNKIDQSNVNSKTLKSILKVELYYLIFFIFLIVGLITTLVNYIEINNHTIFINLSIIIDVISLTFVEIFGIILVINQWKLKETSRQNNKILILYFLGLFLVIPTIIVIMKDNRFSSKRTSKNITNDKNIRIYAIYSFLYIFCSLYFYPILISILLTSWDALAYYAVHSLTTFFCCIYYLIFLLIVLELINIKLIIQSVKLEKKYPKEIKKLWIYHLLGFVLIIPNFIVIFVILNKCKKIINKKENEDIVTNLSFNASMNKHQINHIKVNFHTEKEIAEAKENIDFFERVSGLYIGFLIIFIFGLAIFLFLVIYYHPCPVFYYIMPLIFTIAFWIIISIIGFFLAVSQAKIELAFPGYGKKICILFILGLLLIIPTIIGIHITTKTCEKITKENKWE